MSLQHDHFFLLTDPGAPIADRLAQIGLVEGSANRHPGQGTANRRFFLPNSTLELLYLDESDGAGNDAAADLQFERRWRDPNASPIGLVMRASGDRGRDPFDGWRYCPDYFDSDQCFLVGANSPLLREPLCICMPRDLPPAPARPNCNPGWQLTALRIQLPVETLSAVLQTVAACAPVSITTGQSHHLEIEFNGGATGNRLDLRPAHPLSLTW